MSDALLPFRRYFQFSGRSRRREFWMYTLFVLVVGIVLSLIDSSLGLGGSFDTSTSSGAGGYSASINIGGGILATIWSLLTLIPSLSVAARRLHDTDRTGWWLLIALTGIGVFVLLIFYCFEGTRGANRFGPDPKYVHHGGTHAAAGTYL